MVRDRENSLQFCVFLGCIVHMKINATVPKEVSSYVIEFLEAWIWCILETKLLEFANFVER